MAENDSFAAFQKRVQARVDAGRGMFPVGIIPRGRRRREEPLRATDRFLHKRRRLRPAIRNVRGERQINDKLIILEAILDEMKRLRRQAAKPAALVEEQPVSRAMESQVQWLSHYNTGVDLRNKTLNKYRKELAKKNEQKKPAWQIAKVQKKIDRVEDMANLFNRMHQDFISTRRDFGNCICPPHGEMFDAWVRKYAEEFGLVPVAHENIPHKGALVRRERRRPMHPRGKALTGMPTNSPLARQQEIDHKKMQVQELTRQIERLERIQRYGGA